MSFTFYCILILCFLFGLVIGREPDTITFEEYSLEISKSQQFLEDRIVALKDHLEPFHEALQQKGERTEQKLTKVIEQIYANNNLNGNVRDCIEASIGAVLKESSEYGETFCTELNREWAENVEKLHHVERHLQDIAKQSVLHNVWCSTNDDEPACYTLVLTDTAQLLADVARTVDAMSEFVKESESSYSNCSVTIYEQIRDMEADLTELFEACAEMFATQPSV